MDFFRQLTSNLSLKKKWKKNGRNHGKRNFGVCLKDLYHYSYFSADPSERKNIAGYKPVLVRKMKARLEHYQKKTKHVAGQSKRKVAAADPKHHHGVWTPGWCTWYFIYTVRVLCYTFSPQIRWFQRLGTLVYTGVCSDVGRTIFVN